MEGNGSAKALGPECPWWSVGGAGAGGGDSGRTSGGGHGRARLVRDSQAVMRPSHLL